MLRTPAVYGHSNVNSSLSARWIENTFKFASSGNLNATEMTYCVFLHTKSSVGSLFSMILNDLGRDFICGCTTHQFTFVESRLPAVSVHRQYWWWRSEDKSHCYWSGGPAARELRGESGRHLVLPHRSALVESARVIHPRSDFRWQFLTTTSHL